MPKNKRYDDPRIYEMELLEEELDKFIENYDKRGIQKIFTNKKRCFIDFLSNQDNRDEMLYFLMSLSDVINGFSPFSVVKEICNYAEERDSGVRSIYRRVALKICQCVIIKRLYQSVKRSKISDYQKKSEKDDVDIYYRGHSDSSWRMVPSLLRGFNKQGIINSDVLIKVYEDEGLLKKYNDRIEKFDKKKRTNIYQLITFMQHSMAYSPILDLTKNFWVAKSFALCNPDKINSFVKTSSTIIKIDGATRNREFDLERINHLVNERLKIYYLGYTSINFGDTITIDDETLVFDTFTHIYELFKPEYIILDYKTNDRMKYQKGAFILFYNYVCVNDDIFYELNDELVFEEITIEIGEKRKELNKIYRSHRKFDYYHLMNPYEYFKE